VQKVEIELDSGIWVTAAGTTSWSFNLNSSNFLNGPHVIAARATDTSGNVSPTNTAGIWFYNVPGNYVQRISGGNPANVTDCSGNLWLADTNYSFGAFGYTGGTTGYLNNVISGVVHQHNRSTSASITARPAAVSIMSLIVPRVSIKPRCSRPRRIGTVPANVNSTSSSRVSRC
jgi:hypothetical protein